MVVVVVVVQLGGCIATAEHVELQHRWADVHGEVPGGEMSEKPPWGSMLGMPCPLPVDYTTCCAVSFETVDCH